MGFLIVHVLDEDENPVSGKRVFCNFPGIAPTHSLARLARAPRPQGPNPVVGCSRIFPEV